MKTRRHRIRFSITVFSVFAAAVAIGPGAAQAGQTSAQAQSVAGSPGQMVIIDAKTNPQDAVAALKLYKNATDRSFTPTTDPIFGQSEWQSVYDLDGNLAPSVTGNAKTGQAVTERLTVTHEEDSSWSLGGSVEASVGFNLAGIVDAELSIKFTANHTWKSSTVDTQGI